MKFVEYDNTFYTLPTLFLNYELYHVKITLALWNWGVEIYIYARQR
jgi:hypothetical protein